MRITRTVLSAGAFIACAACFIAPSQALAGTPGYPGCSMEVTPDEASPGDSVNLVGSGFQPAFTTEIFIDGISIGTVLTDGTGAFDTDREVPDGAGPGIVTVSAACDGTGANLSSTELTIPGDTLPDLTLSKAVVERLEEFVATVTNAEPGSTVSFERFSVATPVGSATADAVGTASLTISFPADATLGAHEVQATGVDADADPFELTEPIEVIAGDGSLPQTGSDVEPLVIAGGLAVLAGAAFVLVARRRRRGHQVT